MDGKFRIALLLLLPLAACSSLPPPVQQDPSACAAGESTYACQVERYRDVNS
jgi:hypothetical protein